jgi:NADPH:quinone reductase-like Zn-dependent oxidoreductase
LRAVRIHHDGAAQALRYEEAPDPEISSPDDVLIRIGAAGVSPMQKRTRRRHTLAAENRPRVVGADGAGTIVEVGPAVATLKAGDKVLLYPLTGCNRCIFCRSGRDFMCADVAVLGNERDGTYAEYIMVAARNCFRLPAHLTLEQAAGLPSSYLKAWKMLMSDAGLKPGERVVIKGLTAIGTAALQIAVQSGAVVIAVSHDPEKISRAKKFGAAQGILSGQNAVQEVRNQTGKRGIDIVVDCVSGDGWSQSLAMLAKGGRLVTCGADAGAMAQTDVRRIFWNHLKIFGSIWGSREDFQQLVNFFEATKAMPVNAGTFSLRDVAAAQRFIEEKQPFGTVVLRMDH